MRVAGIDPGKTGYLCVLDDEISGTCVPSFWPCPVFNDDFDRTSMVAVVLEAAQISLEDSYNTHKNLFVVIEAQQSFPGRGPRCPVCHKPKQQQGVASTFLGGKGYGLWLGILSAFGLPVHTVAPQEWKKPMGLSSDKGLSIRKAEELFPGVDLLRNNRCRVPDHNKAEALLIAVHARKLLKRQS